jgi:hypothetical protein
MYIAGEWYAFLCDNHSEDGEQHSHAVCIFMVPSNVVGGDNCQFTLIAARNRNTNEFLNVRNRTGIKVESKVAVD